MRKFQVVNLLFIVYLISFCVKVFMHSLILTITFILHYNRPVVHKLPTEILYQLLNGDSVRKIEKKKLILKFWELLLKHTPGSFCVYEVHFVCL